MNVKLKLERLGAFSLKRFQSKKDEFTNYFNLVCLEPFEPKCPFCGNYLINAKCFCEEYQKAFEKICLEYSKMPIFVEAYDAPLIYGTKITSDQISMEEVNTSGLDMSLFDSGSKTFGFGIGSWFISNGVYENSVLSFYARPKGKKQVYQCKIKCYIHVKDYTKIYFWHYQDIGALAKKTTLATISYDNFLQKLKEYL